MLDALVLGEPFGRRAEPAFNQLCVEPSCRQVGDMFDRGVNQLLEVSRCQVDLLAAATELAYAQSLLGHCLTDAGQHDEAEPLLLSGYTAMKNDASVPAENIREGLEWIVKSYESSGKTDEAARWRTVLTATPDGDGERSRN